MRKVAGGLMVAELAFWLPWIALLQGTPLIPLFRNVGRFNFSKFIDFIIHLDIRYI